jgi:hypothetical protein
VVDGKALDTSLAVAYDWAELRPVSF